MMKKLPLVLVCAAVCARSAFAQTAPVQTAPVAGERGRFAAAFDGGVTFPFGAGYDPGWTVNGSFDYYLSHLFAIRGTAGYASSSTSFTDSFTRSSFLASGVWQFDRGALRPYGRIGVGVTRSRLPSAPPGRASASTPEAASSGSSTRGLP